MPKTNKPETLTIGIPVYNEGQSLPCSYTSLVDAINQLPRNVRVEVLYCLNGCTDDSERILRDLAVSDKRIEDITIMTSEPGKMNAQLAILANRKYKDGPICFADADITMSDNTLGALLNKLQQDPNCQAAYAHVKPHYHGHTTPFQDLLLTHYNSREQLPPRNYIHGRTFMMRDGRFLETMKEGLAQRVERVRREEDPVYVDCLGLKDGPKVDDIYLSRVIAHQHGVPAIAEVKDAVVHFHPPATLKDYHNVIERTRTEIRRLDLLYPEHRDMQRLHFKRDFDIAAHTNLSSAARRELLLLREIEDAHAEAVDESLVLPHIKPNGLGTKPWISAPTTKKGFGTGADGNFITQLTNGAIPPAGTPGQIIMEGDAAKITGEGTEGFAAEADFGADHRDEQRGRHTEPNDKPGGPPPHEPGGMH